jgi:hypothetical protein
MLPAISGLAEYYATCLESSGKGDVYPLGL